MLNVRCFDLFEIVYRADDGEPKTEFFSGSLQLAQHFVEETINENMAVDKITYFVEVVVENGSANPRQPSKRFAERTLKAHELLALPDGWVKDQRELANPEIDDYMQTVYHADLTNGN